MNANDFEFHLRRKIHDFINLLRKEGKEASYQDVMVSMGNEYIELSVERADYSAYYSVNDDFFVVGWSVSNY